MRLYLPPRPASTIRHGRLDLDEADAHPAEALERRLDPKSSPGAAADRVLTGQMEVHEKVIGELRVVRDVDEVIKDLLARAADDDRDADWIHGGAQSTRCALREPPSGA